LGRNKALKLYQEVLSCSACKGKLPNEPRPVLQLHSSASILIAGQAPGIRVHETGLPFNDPSGDRLRQWMGVSREQFYSPETFAIVPMAFCYPGTGKSGDIPPPKICAELWREKILEALPKLKLILAIGAYAQRYHFPEYFSVKEKTSMTKLLQLYLGNPDKFPGRIPLPHPSPRNNIWLKKNPWFEKEFLPLAYGKIQSVVNSGNGEL